jgi:archaellum biogenesis ATPase FlaH
MTEQLNQYNEDTQKVLMSFMMSEPSLFARSRNIIKDEYFDNKLRPAVRFIMEYSDEYKALPQPVQVKAMTGIDVPLLNDCNPAHGEWFLTTIEHFCRYRAIENVILDGPEMLQKGQGADIERRLRDAMLITLTRDLGSHYFDDPLARLMRLKDRSNLVSTGWPQIDFKLYGGLSRGGLHIFCGGPGSGKSLWMQNLSLNWVEAGMHVLYVTLELSQDLTDFRIDHMVSKMSRAEIMEDPMKAAATITATARNGKAGTLTTKKFSESGTTSNDLRAYLKEYTIQMGYAPDVMCVDYLDLLYPNNSKVDASNLFVKDKFVSEELRAIAGDYDFPLVTASQLNRSAVEAQDFDHAHIAGGISKINTADNVFAILFTTAMREKGEYELQFLKTRSAASVGQKVKMAYDRDTLRITDPGMPGESAQTARPTPNAVREELTKKTAVQPALPEVSTKPSAPTVLKDSISSLIANIKQAQKPE